MNFFCHVCGKDMMSGWERCPSCTSEDTLSLPPLTVVPKMFTASSTYQKAWDIATDELVEERNTYRLSQQTRTFSCPEISGNNKRKLETVQSFTQSSSQLPQLSSIQSTPPKHTDPTQLTVVKNPLVSLRSLARDKQPHAAAGTNK